MAPLGIAPGCLWWKWGSSTRGFGSELSTHDSISGRTSGGADLILSLVPLYPQRLSTCWNRLMLHSFPRRQQRGRSMNSTRGFGFTVKWRNRLTTSRSVRIPDWAGPAEEHESSDVSALEAEGILGGGLHGEGNLVWAKPTSQVGSRWCVGELNPRQTRAASRDSNTRHGLQSREMATERS